VGTAVRHTPHSENVTCVFALATGCGFGCTAIHLELCGLVWLCPVWLAKIKAVMAIAEQL
jgi:hypothetical protein